MKQLNRQLVIIFDAVIAGCFPDYHGFEIWQQIACVAKETWNELLVLLPNSFACAIRRILLIVV
jgi:hypothetical protein